MTSIIKDSSLSNQLLASGYVSLPFLTVGETEALAALFNRYSTIEANQKGLYSNLYALGSETNWQISEELEKICSRAFDENFCQATLNGGVFIAKGANPDTGCYLHQDPSITYESQYATYALWIPLVDIDETTGLFYAVEGSHKMRQHVRCYNNPSKGFDVNTVNQSKLKSIRMKAGEALVFDHALVHGSAANLSPNVRVAAVLGIMPENTPYTFFWKTGTEQFAAYKMDKEYFIKNQIPDLQKGQVAPERLKETITAPETADLLLLG